MTRDDIITEAMSWIGTPYHHQASLKAVGCDCLGLVRGIYRALYGPEPEKVPAYAQHHVSGEGERLIAGISEHLVPAALPGEPGDVIVFRLRPGAVARHCGVLIEPLRFVHAVSGRSISAAALSPWWARRIAACFSFPDIEQ
jgi:NlpC/P60 family putative phage cell wall peptidase